MDALTQFFVGMLALGALIALRRFQQAGQQRRIERAVAEAQEAVQDGDLDTAEAALRTCVKLAPLSVPARQYLGAVLAKQGRLEEAEEELRMAADLQPKNGEGHLQLGVFYAACFDDRHEDALDALEKALAHDARLRDRIEGEPRLKPLQSNPRLRALLSNDNE